MNVTTRRATASLLALGLFAISSTALATNGYFTHGIGAQSKGMAGTGVGSNADMGAIMTASNPALGVFVDDSWEAGLSVFSPRRSYEAFESQLNGNFLPIPGCDFDAPTFADCLPSHTIAEGKVDSSSEWFPIPYVAKNWSLASGANITGAFYGRGGMNTDWDDPNALATSYFCNLQLFGTQPVPEGQGPFCNGTAGVDLSQAFLSVTYSAMSGDNFAWGIGPIIAAQAFEARGVGTFTPVTKSFLLSGGTVYPSPSLSNNGHEMSFGFGLTAGIWWSLSDKFSAGLSYQSKIAMGEFDDYADLFAEDGDFDIPSSIKAGISYVANDILRINFDVEHTAFSDVGAVGNPMANLFSCPAVPEIVRISTDIESCLGGSNGAGFGWDDMTTYKLGFELQRDEGMIMRFGYSYGEQPVQPDDVLFNILAPGVMEQHITFGLSTKAANGGEWNFSFMYSPEKSVKGFSAFDPTQQIEVTMNQLEFEVSYSF
jgi:long-chain fatty acid transport protein